MCLSYPLGSFYSVIATIFTNANKPCGSAPVCTPDVLAKSLEAKNFRKSGRAIETKEFNFEALASLGLKLKGCSNDKKALVKSFFSGAPVIAGQSENSTYWYLILGANEREAQVGSPRNIYFTNMKWTSLNFHCVFAWV
eukprot:TRINITY_DN82_c0_g1_i1.p1 TRINITY_DN82_c0_g1~~TRINITY_DN82_c0_g1_i1.p1  ORF type:complete len:139 (-),score=35.52 TRINITY_DN82_c0_g1_i1:59-475(-)